MSDKVTREEMLEAWDELLSFYVDRSPNPGDVPELVCDAIRVLIEAVGEWKEITNKLLAPGTSTGHYLKNQTLLYKIRDFGKEER